MKVKNTFLILILLHLFVSCNLKELTEILFQDKVEKNRDEEKITYEEAERRVDLYLAITIKNVDKVREYLEKGYNPNRCVGEEGWMVGTPLNVVARSFYNTYIRQILEMEIPEDLPDMAIFKLLVDAGADINERPYIWCRIYTFDDMSLKDKLVYENLIRTGKPPRTDKEKEELEMQRCEDALSYVKVSNRLIEAFLKAGADPDKKGHPYPYSLEAKKKKITDEQAEKYFAKGTRPINEAIKKGMWWESQVDLLLQYTTLDKDSLKAAKESKDKAMIEKITRLWNEQNGGK